MKKEIPILFSTPMVQAILAGRKTMTRRVVKPQLPIGTKWHEVYDGELNYRIVDEKIVSTLCKCPYGKPGDLLWVRENWAARDCNTSTGVVKLEYQASEGEYSNILLKKSVMILYAPLREKKKWKPCIHLPKEAARIWLEVTDVRVERLQEVTDREAAAEGIEYVTSPSMTVRGWRDYENAKPENGPNFYREVMSFRSLWSKINGPESWEANSWVWVVSFRVLSTTGKPVISNSCDRW